MADTFASDIQKTEKSVQKESEVSVSKKTAPEEPSRKEVVPSAPQYPPPQYAQQPGYPPQIQPQVANAQALPPPIVQPQGSHTCLKATLIGIEIICFIVAFIESCYLFWCIPAILASMLSLGLLISALVCRPMSYAYLIVGIIKIICIVIRLIGVSYIVYLMVLIETQVDTGAFGKAFWAFLLTWCVVAIILHIVQAIIAFILYRKKA